MQRILLISSLLALLSALFQSNLARSADNGHPRAALFGKYCSGCHLSAQFAAPDQTAPTLDYLRSLTAASLKFAINEGVMYGQASVLSHGQKTLIVDHLAATGSRKVLALDATSKSAKWIFDAPTRLRSPLAYGSLGPGQPRAIVYRDAEGFVYALDAGTGKLLWSTDVRSHGRAMRLTGGMVLVDSGYGRVSDTPGNVLLAFVPHTTADD